MKRWRYVLSCILLMSLVGSAQTILNNKEPMSVAGPYGIAVPYYSFSTAYGERGYVTPDGVTSPGPYGAYIYDEISASAATFLCRGYRPWCYPGETACMCIYPASFNFPGDHPVWYGTECSYTYIGSMAAWGSVIADPRAQTITGLACASNHNGPTASYCIPFGSGQICYPPKSNWGSSNSYGYIRKAIKVVSDGSIPEDSAVTMKVKFTLPVVISNPHKSSANVFIILNRIARTYWLQHGLQYIDHHNWEMFSVDTLNSMLGYIKSSIDSSGFLTDSIMATVSVGDTLILESMMANASAVPNPGSAGGDFDAWLGDEPTALKDDPNNIYSERVKQLILSYGNTLTITAEATTAGASLTLFTGSDDDNDGIANEEEQGPNADIPNYDGNGDGTPDCQQENVVSLYSYFGRGYVTIATPPGTTISDCHPVPVPSLQYGPTGLSFPCDMMEYTITGMGIGGSTTVTKYLPFTPSTCYKYGPTPDTTSPHWYEFLYNGLLGAEINGSVVTIHLTDGQQGDDDITANGRITDPVGLTTVETGVDDNHPLSSAHYKLAQNYPNPFNPVTNISFHLPSHSFVTLRVFDILGREMATLVSEKLPPGTYTRQWNATGMPSGIYFYRLAIVPAEGTNSQSGIFTETKKLVFVR
jgi:hypothetical protein